MARKNRKPPDAPPPQAQTPDLPPPDVPPPDEDVEILRAKFRAVNAYIEFTDETVRWMRSQLDLALNLQLEPGANKLLKSVNEMLRKADRPAPSRDLIKTDLAQAWADLGPSYEQRRREALAAVTSSWTTSDQALDDLVEDPRSLSRHDAVIDATVALMNSVARWLERGTEPARLLRDRLTARLAAVNSTTAGARAEVRKPSDEPEPPAVTLGKSHNHSVLVRGRRAKSLTRAQYDVVAVLLKAGPAGLTKDQLVTQSHHTDAVSVLKRLARSDDDWRTVIHLAVRAGRGYRIS